MTPPPATDAEVLAALARVPGGVVRVERKPSPRESSFRLEEVDAELTDGSRVRLVFKDLGREALTAAGG